MLKPLLGGIASYVPGVSRLRSVPTGGTDSARYCYSVWLRHLSMASAHGLDTAPRNVAELGPGDSLGIGLAALLTGAESYLGMDVVRYASNERNQAMLEELVRLLASREAIPGEDELPDVKPYLDDYRFPEQVLTSERLERTLAPERVERIRQSVRDPDREGSLVRYRVPWLDTAVIEPATVDLVFSQTVLQHVDDLREAYRGMARWLRPGGAVSHQIDLKCLRTATEWNGHWTYSDLTWKLIRGRRPYLINREPCSGHLRLLEESGFQIRGIRRVATPSALERRDLAARFRDMTDDDLTTSGLFVQAVKASG